MSQLILDRLRDSFAAAPDIYHSLVLLVGDQGSGKSKILGDFASELNRSVINVNLALSERLMELSNKQRVLRLPELLDALVSQEQPLVVLDNIEIMFDKDLRQDPLRLLQSISRYRTVVASWNGIMNSGRLMYAEAGHREYRSYDSVDALIVGMDGTTTVDTARKNREAGIE